MIKIGINGLGRIGKAIIRNNLEKRLVDIVAVNDINPDPENLVYQLNYDTVYGRMKPLFKYENGMLSNGEQEFKLYQESSIDDVAWKEQGVDIIIDATGVKENVLRARNVIEKNLAKKVLITHSPDEGTDFEMVLGANEQNYDPSSHHVISSSICDATALAPTLKVINDTYGIASGAVTTIHPFLSYQKLIDGPPPGVYPAKQDKHHYAMGRSSTESLLAKGTTAVKATTKVLDGLKKEMFAEHSYRPPTQIVGAADVTLNLKEKTSVEEVRALFEEKALDQKWNIFDNNYAPLSSIDFKQSDFSVAIDQQYTKVIEGKLLKLHLWYDNEFGYAARVLDQAKYVGENL